MLIGARNIERARAAAEGLSAQNLNVGTVRIDLDDLTNATNAANEIRSQYGRLDILVNNAGIFDFADAEPSRASIDAARRVMEINFIGALAVTQAMLPLLKNSPAGRIVNISSSLGSLTLNGDPDLDLLRAAIHRIQRIQGSAKHAYDSAARRTGQ